MSQRPETGLMQFGDDWTGVFIRGDNAAYFAMILRNVLDGDDSPIARATVEGLVETLTGSDERKHGEETDIQKLRSWPECQPNQPKTDERKAKQRSMDRRLRAALADRDFRFISKNVGRDDLGVYVEVGAFIGEAVATRKVYQGGAPDLWDDDVVTRVVEAFAALADKVEADSE